MHVLGQFVDNSSIALWFGWKFVCMDGEDVKLKVPVNRCHEKAIDCRAVVFPHFSYVQSSIVDISQHSHSTMDEPTEMLATRRSRRSTAGNRCAETLCYYGCKKSYI